MKKLATEACEVFVVAFAACVAIGCAVGLFVGVAFLLALPAKAQEGYDRRDSRWHTQRFCANYAWDGSCTRYRYERRRYYRPIFESAYRDRPVRYYAAPREWDGDERRDQICKDVRKAVGDQHLTADGAKKAAGDNWAGAVRFHYGEKWMDLANARHITYVCSRSSIKEGGVTTLGQTLTRCELSAIPCHAPTQRQEGE